jgi:type VI secretion system secreted protein Hcp
LILGVLLKTVKISMNLYVRGFCMRVKSLFLPVAFCLSFASMSFGAFTVHLTLTSEVQDWIRGDSEVQGRENTIEVAGYSHMLVAEPDPITGIAGLVRDHFPVTIIKRFDQSSPQLFQAWRDHEICTAVFRFYRHNPATGGDVNFYTVTLNGAYISGIRQEALNNLVSATAGLPELERISFTYRDITELWINTGFTCNDRWHANTTKIPFSDLNFDGIVNVKDFAIMADEWLMQY